MRCFISIASILAILALGWGCTPPVPKQPIAPGENCLFRDSTGDIIATAYIELPQALPTGEASFVGTWKLRSSKPSFPSGATKSGSYTGYFHEGAVSIYLNPDALHNSIIVAWPANPGTMPGRWWLMTDSGGRPMGTFYIKHLPNGKAD